MLTPVQDLKIRLMTDGMEVTPVALRRLQRGDEERPVTLADYASTSGISMALEGDVWANVPITAHNPNFVERPPHVLDVAGSGYVVRSGDLEVRAEPVPVPDYHSRTNRWGEAYTSYAYSHTDRVRISPIEGCGVICKFCDLPFEYRYRTKRIEGLVDSVRVALEDEALPAKHVLISGGTPKKSDHGYLQETYRAVLSAFPDTPVDIMMMPVDGLLDLDELGRLGVNQLSINIEMFNEELARKVMPAKARAGIQSYLDFIEGAVQQLGPGSVRSLILVGIEPEEDTLRGVEALAARGAEPVLSPFRPDPKTPMAGHAPPTVEQLRRVYLRSVEVAARYGVKLGPRCIPCMHNTLTFPDDSGHYFSH